MVVRIRFGKRPPRDLKRAQVQRFAQGIAALLKPAALIAFVFAFWRIAADLHWTKTFAIPAGLFSHWQVWVGAAVFLQFCSYALNRYGRTDRTAS